MTPKLKKARFYTILSHAIGIGVTPLFILAAKLTRSWGLFRVGDCLYRRLFHLYCPGCGGTRAVLSLVQFDIRQAFIYSPPLFAAIFTILWCDFWLLLAFIKKDEKYLKFVNRYVAIGLIVFSVLFSVLRSVLAYTVGYDPLGDLTL